MGKVLIIFPEASANSLIKGLMSLSTSPSEETNMVSLLVRATPSVSVVLRRNG